MNKIKKTDRHRIENQLRKSSLKKDEKIEDILKQMNHDLQKNHKELLLDTRDVKRFPFLFVFGLPRSGTTLLMQLLANCLDVGYINNLAARFWLVPIYGIMLSKMLLNKREQEYVSSWGKTNAINGPHEFSYFWHDWFKLAESDPDDEIETEEIQKKTDWHGLKQILLNMAHYFDRPMLFKGMWPAYFLEQFIRVIPHSLFIYISRKEEDVAVSLYHTRIEYYKNPKIWWSMRPPEYKQLKNLPWNDQIAGQVFFLKNYYLTQIAAVDSKNTILLDYENLCHSPKNVLESIQSRVKKEFSYAIDIIKDPPERFEISRYDSNTYEYKLLKESLKKFKKK